MKSKTILKQYHLIVMLLAMLVTMGVMVSRVQAQEQTPVYLPIVLKGGTGSGGGSSSSNFDLVVSLYNAPIGGQRAAYEANIRYFADSVFEMSNGAHKIRQVRIYSNRQFADRADIIWVASCWPNANPSGYGRGGGARIEMCDNFQGTSLINTDRDQQEGGYTIGHEWGHYFYGMMDEYQGGTSAPGDLGNPEPTDNPVQNSIMNSQSQAVDGDFRWLNFSTSLNNGPGGQNAHRRVFQASAWETLARPPSQDPAGSDTYSTGGSRLYYADLANFAPAAGQAPSNELPAGRTEARNQLQIEWMGNSPQPIQAAAVTEPSIVRYIVIENSDSMAANDKLFNVIDAAGVLIDEAEIGDMIGIISFDTTVTVVQPLTKIDSESTRTTILNALDTITLGGNGAATGSAAHQALTEITGGSIPAELNRATYLISGGPVTTGWNLALSVIPAYAAADIELYTFGYGVDEVTETKLQNAEMTGGKYRFIDDSNSDEAFEELLDAFDEADQNLSPIVDINIKTGWGTITSGTPFTVPFVIDSSLGAVEIETLHRGPEISATISLLDPTNTPTGTQVCDTIGSGADLDTVCFLEVSDPISGTWTLQTTTPDPNLEIDYWIGGLAEDGSFTLFADIESIDGGDIDVGQPVTLYATLANDSYKVTDVTISATLIDPNDATSALNFVDDGSGADDVAQDGIYSVSFTPGTAGEHAVRVTFDNNNNLAKFTEYANRYAADPNTGISKAIAAPVLIGENFERFAELELYADTP